MMKAIPETRRAH